MPQSQTHVTTATTPHTRPVPPLRDLIELDDGGYELLPTDRCDRCGAKAYVVTIHGEPGGTIHRPILMWCRHHYLRYADKISEDAVLIDDTNHPELVGTPG